MGASVYNRPSTSFERPDGTRGDSMNAGHGYFLDNSNALAASWNAAEQQMARQQKKKDDEAARAMRQQEFAAQQGAAQQQSALQAQLQREGYANQQAMARIQADAATLAERNKNMYRPAVVSSLMSMLNGRGGRGGITEGYAGGGPVGSQPNITEGGVYSPQQVQERVNASRAQNDVRTATQNAAMERTMAGRGFGSRSPIAMQMANANMMANLGANTQAENDVRWTAAEGNARQLLESQRAREAQYAARQQEDIDRGKVKSGMISGLMGALGGFL